MATGKVDVLRRRDYPKYSKREFEYYRNVLCGDKLSHGRNDGVKFRDEVLDSRRWRVLCCPSISMSGRGFISQQRGLSKKRKFSPVICMGQRREESEVFPSHEVDVVKLLPEKKRKSPVTSDREEKRVRISSNNRGFAAIPPSRLIVSDGVVSKFPASEIQSHEDKPSVVDGLEEISQLEAPADLHNPLHSEAQDNLEGKDQNRISLSADSPRDDVSCRSTPDSGEIRREDSVGDRSRTSSSDEESHPLSGDGGLGGGCGR
ncbi:hypothetical protein M0R45_023904 [Rubus argutus]|uniref:Uncharacterized protein n=1 Tax=Rubus argutus TaxID=59490 RepID=A0AAW1WRJ4_RUBAR